MAATCAIGIGKIERGLVGVEGEDVGLGGENRSG